MSSRITDLKTGPESVQLRLADGSYGEFHHIWLRDNCGCQKCRHPHTQERLFDLLTVPEDIQPAHAEIDGNGALKLIWPGDGHVSVFQPDWLRATCYAGDVSTETTTETISRVLWDASKIADIPEAKYGQVCADNGLFLDWLTALREWGVALLRYVPTDKHETLRFAERIGPARKTNFGTDWDVISMMNPNSNAYTDLPLMSHTDLPNWEIPPGYQLLHCLINEAGGGESILVDGFRVANELRTTAPDSFDLLTQIPLDFRFRDVDNDIHYRSPAIRLGSDGEITEIRFSIALMGALSVPGHLMAAVYRAHRRFAALLRQRRFELRFRLNAGDMMLFDNRRVLHGRTAFDASTGHRHLRGTFMDYDVLDSRIRILRQAMADSAAAGPKS
ncbi:MAG: TauD/TfdA family dioxygenase [Proteobacteria bacterium]|nr:TauD/TfdA family dioxygenase [Pseudomonadota bacterium]